MTADKKQPTTAATETTTRKAWVPKTPVDVVLEQIGKQEKRVAALQKELDQEKILLVKLAKAKAALEA
jgi:transcription antitermination factor NusA-like protein